MVLIQYLHAGQVIIGPLARRTARVEARNFPLIS
jgi:hypothetical protein